jgi:hypothetical protein
MKEMPGISRYSWLRPNLKGDFMPTTLEKLARLEDVRAMVESFLERGGDLKSREAVPLGMEFVHAFDDLAREFGQLIFMPLDKKANFARPDRAS